MSCRNSSSNRWLRTISQAFFCPPQKDERRDVSHTALAGADTAERSFARSPKISYGTHPLGDRLTRDQWKLRGIDHSLTPNEQEPAHERDFSRVSNHAYVVGLCDSTSSECRRAWRNTGPYKSVKNDASGVKRWLPARIRNHGLNGFHTISKFLSDGLWVMSVR